MHDVVLDEGFCKWTSCGPYFLVKLWLRMQIKTNRSRNAHDHNYNVRQKRALDKSSKNAKLCGWYRQTFPVCTAEPNEVVCPCITSHHSFRSRNFIHIQTPSKPRSPMPNARVLRDIKARKGFSAKEIARRAYLFIARNETLPPQLRHRAQLQLNTFDRYARPSTVKNRCIESGRGRGIIGEFGLSRVG